MHGRSGDHAAPESRQDLRPISRRAPCQDRRSSPANACWRRSHHAIMATASRRRSSTTQSAASICPARFGSLTVPTLLTSPRGRLGIGSIETGSGWLHAAPWRATGRVSIQSIAMLREQLSFTEPWIHKSCNYCAFCTFCFLANFTKVEFITVFTFISHLAR